MAATTLCTNHMARKKPVHQKYQPNSYRVISHEAETWQRPQRSTTFTCMSDFNVLGQSAEKYVPMFEHRKNRPNPNHVGFLRQDVRLLNEPVCDVYTDSSQAEQYSWWPSRTSDKPLKKSEHTLDTTVREDFQYRGKDVTGSTRHTANPNKIPANGIAPVNLLREKDGKQRLWKEGISYEHQYNSRLDPQYPIRGKRHGTFVWDRFPQQEVDRMLNHFGIVTDKNGECPTGSKDALQQTYVSPKSAPASKNTSEGCVQSPVSKSAKTIPKEATVIEAVENKPLSRTRTESIISKASEERVNTSQVRLPPIAL